MTREELLTQIEKLQRRWDYHAIEHRAKRENNNPQYNAYDHGVATGYLKALNTFKDWIRNLDTKGELTLTWKDVWNICEIYTDVNYEGNYTTIQNKYETILEEFKKKKEEEKDD